MNRQLAEWITHRWMKWIGLIVMLGIVGGLGFFSSKLESVQENQYENWLPGDAESTLAIKAADEFSDSENIPMVLLYERESGIQEADFAAIQTAIDRVKGIDTVLPEVIGPIPSKDGKAVQVIVTMHLDPTDGWLTLPDVVEDIEKAAAVGGDLNLHMAGPAAFAEAQASAFASLDTRLLFTAVGIVVILLLLTYRSPVLWLLPLICGVLSVGAASGVVYLLAKYADLTVNAQSQFLLSVLVLGASIDYALLLVARYREELRTFEDRHEAMAHALHRAAPAILASGLTVAFGMMCLVIADMNSTASLGPVLAAGIAVSLLVMLVLLPILLVIFGRWVFWPFIPHFGSDDHKNTGIWAKVGNAISMAPRAVWIVTALVLAAGSLGLLKLDSGGLAPEEYFIDPPAAVTAAKELGEHFPAGGGAPVQVIANKDAAGAVRDAFAGVDGIAPDSVQQLGQSETKVYFEGTLTDESGSNASFDTIERVRDTVHAVDGAEALVGGEAAIYSDTQQASSRDNVAIIPLVLVVILVILMVLLRAILAPIILLGTVVLSFGASIGLSVLIFDKVFGFAGTDAAFPLFVFVFLVALGVDYNIFLMTRVREESLKHGTRRGSLIALAATGGVITSAGLVLAGTFGAFATMPLVFAAELGFAVALGVILDTFIVRSVLVTALNLDIGRHIWWPSQLSKKDDELEWDEPEKVSVPVS